MMKKNALFILLIFFLNINLFSQEEDIEFSSKKFPGRSKELSVAKSQIKYGEINLDNNNFEEALKLLLKAYDFNPNNSILNFDIGFCYFNMPQKFQSLSFFKKAYKLNPKIKIKGYKDINFYLAQANHWDYKFDTAINYYKNYIETLNPKNKEEINIINKCIQECNNGIILMKDTLNVKITNLGENVNSEYKEYGPLVVSDGSKIYFTSRRKGTTGGDIFMPDRLYYEDIYETNRTASGWTKARSVGSPLNTKVHDAVVGLSPDGQQLFVYADKNGGDIYVSILNGSRWSRPKPLSGEINSPAHESKASISYDNKTLYFISDRKDLSIGGKDIFYSTLDNAGNWSAPKNLSNKINTPYDEVDLFLHPDGRTIYFSSKGHNSMGGFDIFKSVMKSDGEWEDPINIGYPINTPDDDVFYVTTASGKFAYFVSVRNDGYGVHDLYEISFLQPIKSQTKEKEEIKENEKPIKDRVLVTLVRGTVIDAITKLALEVNIDIVDLQTSESVANFQTNSFSGKYIINLPSGKNYGINVNKQGYMFHSENFNLPDTADFQEFVVDIELKKLEVGTTITLKNIFFDYDKSSLRPESESELALVIEVLNNNPKIQIEISGHTDSIGSDDYNKNLSQERAKAIVDYLINKGIIQTRLSYKGYGKEKPIATNETDEGRQLNRRVEFKIVAN